jgi:hypothetical protein
MRRSVAFSREDPAALRAVRGDVAGEDVDEPGREEDGRSLPYFGGRISTWPRSARWTWRVLEEGAHLR